MGSPLEAHLVEHLAAAHARERDAREAVAPHTLYDNNPLLSMEPLNKSIGMDTLPPCALHENSYKSALCATLVGITNRYASRRAHYYSHTISWNILFKYFHGKQ